MSFYVHGNVITSFGLASNNRAVNMGNTATMQKIRWKDEEHTCLNGETIRYSWRRILQEMGEEVNRHIVVHPDGSDAPLEWHDTEFDDTEGKYTDDDAFGYMHPSSGKKRTSRLSVNKAVSLIPWTGDITFNTASVGASPHAVSDTAKHNNSLPNPVPYASEQHATRYQFPFTLTPGSLQKPERSLSVLRAVGMLSKVGGNHTNFSYDFAPDSVVLRFTQRPDHRFSYCFESVTKDVFDAQGLLRSVEVGDIKAEELYIGGTFADTSTGAALAKAGCHTFRGVDQCIESVCVLLSGVKADAGVIEVPTPDRKERKEKAEAKRAKKNGHSKDENGVE
jgi:CRISPR-associated protein Cst2